MAESVKVYGMPNSKWLDRDYSEKASMKPKRYFGARLSYVQTMAQSDFISKEFKSFAFILPPVTGPGKWN